MPKRVRKVHQELMLFHVCDFERGCVALTKYPEEAAMLASALGENATVQDARGWLLWSQMLDGDAGESYDDAAEKIMQRLYYPRPVTSPRPRPV